MTTIVFHVLLASLLAWGLAGIILGCARIVLGVLVVIWALVRP